MIAKNRDCYRYHTEKFSLVCFLRVEIHASLNNQTLFVYFNLFFTVLNTILLGLSAIIELRFLGCKQHA